ncbi:MAG: glucosamine-6-phosphate isomerase [Lachnospiraceae bacterium]|nr:glucosamine-6-phosphate isomerase [Lachnospiraceae bacterium]
MSQSYFQISAKDLGKEAKVPLIKCGDSGEVFYEIALEMISIIKENNAAGKKTVFICPVGPVGQYPIFVRLVNEGKVSLKNVWFINMDEYLNDDETYIDESSKLSFHGFMNRTVYTQIDSELVMPAEQRIFPDPKDPGFVWNKIQELGGVDACFGGIGINGHVAFNESQDELTPEEFAELPTRVLTISRETRVANAIGDLNGAIDAMPTKCVTIGMKEILSAKKIRLGVFRDWHRSVVRQAAYGEVTAHFPVSLVQRHPDALIYVNANAAQQPF